VQSGESHEARSKHNSYFLPASCRFLLGLLFDLEDRVDMYLRNFGWFSQNHTTRYIQVQIQYSGKNDETVEERKGKERKEKEMKEKEREVKQSKTKQRK
jgi:hypothetical protein